MPLPTVGSERKRGHTKAEIWCNSCMRYAVVSTDDMPDDLPVIHIARNRVCSVCGGRQVTSRMSIEEFYDKLKEDTGMGLGNEERPGKHL